MSRIMSHVKRLRPRSKLVGGASSVIEPGHGAEISVDSRDDHNRGCCAAFNARPHEANVLQIDRRIGGLGVRIVELLDRIGLSGKRALAHEQVFRSENSHIAGDHVAGVQVDDVSGDQVAQRHLLRLAIPKDIGGHVDHGFELRRRRIRAGFLHKAQRRAEHHHACHHRPGARVTRGKGDRRESCQQNHQRVAKDDQEPYEPAAPAFPRNLVWADGARSRFSLRLCQTLGSRVQRLKQCCAVLRRRIEDGGGNTDVVVLGLCNGRRLVRRRRSSLRANTRRAAFPG